MSEETPTLHNVQVLRERRASPHHTWRELLPLIVALWPRAGAEDRQSTVKAFTAEPRQSRLSPSSKVEISALRSLIAAMLVVLLQLPGFEASAQQPTKPSSQAPRLYVYRQSKIVSIGNLDVPFSIWMASC